MGNFINKLGAYQVIPRDLIFDNTLSDRARFVYCYMASKPNNWEFFMTPMAKEIGYSVDTLRKYINELIESGWLIKGEQKNDGLFGAVTYTLNSTKISDTEKIRYGEMPTQHNRDNRQNTDSKQEEEKDIDKSISEKKANNSTWRADIEVYRKEVEDAKEQLINDTEFKANFMNMYPNADYLRSIMKSMQYWTSEKAWELKKKGKSRKINMLTTLKNNLEKSVVYKNNQDEPIENLRMLNVEYKDKKEGTLADGTFIKGAYRYYFSYREKRALSIPINAPMMPSEKCEYDYNSKNWYLPRESETINDLLW